MIEEHRFPCANCGADYRFDPERGALVCEHCGHTEPIAGAGPWGGGIQELDFRDALRNVGCPDSIAEELMGHVQEGTVYGEGVWMQTARDWLEKIAY